MTETERRALGQGRRLAFQNIANGVPPERVMADLRLSRLELDQALKFVGRKVVEYLVLRRQPPVACDNIGLIRANRLVLVSTLARIGDLDLSTDLILTKLLVQDIDHGEMVIGVNRRIAEWHTPARMARARQDEVARQRDMAPMSEADERRLFERLQQKYGRGTETA